MITYAKNVEISKLDAKLPRQHLEPWIRSLVGTAKQEWTIADCAQPTDKSRDEDPTICGKLFSQLPDGRQLRVWIAIGSHKTGVKAPPTLWLAYFGVPGQEKPAAKLSDVPGLMKGVVSQQWVSEIR
jgi:hypothetical protein